MTAIQIAVKSAFQLWHIGKIQNGTLELAKKDGYICCSSSCDGEVHPN